MKTAVCGIGNMGKRYAFYLQNQKIRGLELQALTRIRPADREMFAPSFQNGVQVYESAGSLLDSIEAGKEQIGELYCTEAEYRYTSKDSFRKIRGIWHTMEAPAQDTVLSRAAKEEKAFCWPMPLHYLPGRSG